MASSIAFAVVASVVAACAPLTPARAQSDPFAAAARAIAADDGATALAVYESFVADHPADRLAPVAVFSAANLRAANEDWTGAIAGYERLLDAHGDNEWAPEAARRLGECYQTQHRWAQAADAYGRALALGGGREETRGDWVDEVALAAADCYYELGDRAEVIATYERVLRSPLAPEAECAVLFRLGDCYEIEGRSVEAAARYAEILERCPCAGAFVSAVAKDSLLRAQRVPDLDVYRTHARSGRELSRRDFEAARAHADSVIAATDNDLLRGCARYRRTLAETALTGDFTAGVRALERLRADSRIARSVPELPEQMDRMRQVSELERRAAADSTNVELRRNLGLACLRAGAVTRAIAILERARDLDPADARTQQSLGFAYASAGRNPEAGRAFDAYLKDHPQDTMTLNIVGYTYLGMGDAQTALTYFRRYVEAAPDDANAHDSYGEGLLAAGDLPGSAAEYERAVKLDPSFMNSWYMLGRIRQQLGESARAADAYRRALELAPADPRSEEARAAVRAANSEQSPPSFEGEQP